MLQFNQQNMPLKVLYMFSEPQEVGLLIQGIYIRGNIVCEIFGKV